MVIQYKCPDCGADMVFDSTIGKLHCDSCGHEETVENFSQNDFEPFEEHFHSSTFEDEDVHQYQCKNCGAILITDADTTATTCSFCGSPMILGDRLTGVLAPSKVIPFSISKTDAQIAFKKWCRRAFFSPSAFKQATRIKSIVGMYIPFWLYDVRGNGEALAHCTRVHTHDEGDYIVESTSHYDVYRKVNLTYRNIPADASEKMPDDLMDLLEPFDYSNLKEFNTPYLAGFLAEKYNYTDKEMFGRIRERVSHYMDSYVLEHINGYATKNIVNKDYQIGQLNADYALMPVWMVYYDYDNAEYTFAMNGQTGKIAGMPPISPAKVVLSAGGLTILLFVIFRLITILMGGPIV